MPDEPNPLQGQFEAHVDPAYYVSSSPMTGGSLLAIKDKAGEWHRFLLPPHEVMRICGLLLTACSPIPPPMPEGEKAN